jgi:tetratricopeptide (TPR) repeat protein
LDSSRATEWSRTAWALAILFGSLPLVSRLVLGAWEFEDAASVAGLCLIAGTYFHFLGRRTPPAVPDPATLLDQANSLAASGQRGDAMGLLTEAIRLSPRLWQAFQYRGELYLWLHNPAAALADFTEAVRLAPGEQHLYTLRAAAHRLLGDEAAANQDQEAASRFGQIQN